MTRKPRATGDRSIPKARKTKAGAKGKKKAEPKPKADWEEIEMAFRAGVKSIRAIAGEHGITDKAVRNKAQQFGWQRDLSAKLDKEVRTQLVRTSIRSADAKSDDQIVKEAAATQIEIIHKHRKSIGRYEGVVDRLLDELEESSAKREEIEEDIEAEVKGDKSSERRERMLRAVSLSTRAGIAEKLSSSLAKLVTMERQAFSLDRVMPAENPLNAIFEVIDGSRWSSQAA